MFEFFLKNRNKFIGVDFGTSAIKVIELSSKQGKIYLENYGIFDLAGIIENEKTPAENSVNQSYEDRMKRALRSLMKNMGIKNGSAIVSVPSYSGLITLLEFPEMKKDEIEKAIEFEAYKYIPTSVDEVSISWEILEDKNGQTEEDEKKNLVENKKIEVVLVAAPKKEIIKYEEFLNGTGLKIKAVEIETFSIVRSLIGNRQGNFIIVDIGLRTTNIILVRNGFVVLSRNIEAGGDDITKSITESFNVSKQRAEAIKREKKDIINDNEVAVVIPVLELLIGEIKRMMMVFSEKNKKDKIDELVLSGGASLMKGIDIYFSEKLNIKVEQGDPWKNIEYDKKLEKQIKEIGNSFSVVIGLAVRGFEDK